MPLNSVPILIYEKQSVVLKKLLPR